MNKQRKPFTVHALRNKDIQVTDVDYSTSKLEINAVGLCN